MLLTLQDKHIELACVRGIMLVLDLLWNWIVKRVLFTVIDLVSRGSHCYQGDTFPSRQAGEVATGNYCL
jgi:hypothetical protein